MKKRKLKIINFLYLDDEKYNKIREYRNQEYIRKVSLDDRIITKEEHQNYKKLLEKKDKYFAYLITCDDEDYAVITFKKLDDDTYNIGEYLVKEEYKYEGGGVVNRYCILLLCNKLDIKLVRFQILWYNSRGFKAGNVSKIKESTYNQNNGFIEGLLEMLDFNDKEVVESKARKLFDKMYEIIEVKL